ncbi:DEAD/DEAH box helicase family protein, partial [bacterium]|nr:DEAD/DEAH box helicase family protein [bacterium]
MLEFLHPLPEGRLALFPSQVEALQELHASQIGGCLCMGVGSGKTYVSFLAADALGSEETLLFVPPRLLGQSQREYTNLSRSFTLKHCDWLKYSQLSLRSWAKTQATLVAAYKGKSLVVVFDEAHMLRHRSSARTKRALRLLADLSQICDLKVVVMSGTLLNGVASHYWHLVVSALHDRHWLPMDQRTLQKLDAALVQARSGRTNYIGAQSCEYLNGVTSPESNTMRWYLPKDEFLDGYARAIRETVGSVLSARTDVGATLRIDTWSTPNLGQEAVAMYRQ